MERAGTHLARLGWVTPMSLTPAETYAILDTKTPTPSTGNFVDLYEGVGEGCSTRRQRNFAP